MGQLHNELNPRAGLSKAVRAILGSIDHEGGLERFSETLSLEMDLWSRVEWALPRGEVVWEMCPTASAVALNNSFIAMLNPVGSAAIVVIDGYQIVGQAVAQDVQLAFGNVPPGSAVGRPFCMDTRRVNAIAANSTTTIAEAGQFGAIIGTNFRHHILAAGNDQTPLPLGIVLTPGFFVIWETTAQNVALQVNIRGREYKAQSSELVV